MTVRLNFCRGASIPLVMLSSYAWAVWDMPLDKYFGSVDATISVCAQIDPKGVELAIANLKKTLTEAEKKTWTDARNTKAYKAVYEEELHRLESLSAENRLTACKRAW